MKGREEGRTGGVEGREELVEHFRCGGVESISVTLPQLLSFTIFFHVSPPLSSYKHFSLFFFWPSVLQELCEIFLFTFMFGKKIILGVGGNVRVPRPLLRWSPLCSFCSILFKTFRFLTLTTIFFFFWCSDSSGKMKYDHVLFCSLIYECTHLLTKQLLNMMGY